MARLSVNLNKVALLRNSRHTGSPSVIEFAERALRGGVAGLTVHPRPDERHIRRQDVFDLARLMASVRPEIEFNIEGRPTSEFLSLIAEIRPEQVTLVPDSPEAFTSDSGWNVRNDQSFLRRCVVDLHRSGARVILFLDPSPAAVEGVTDTGADGIEIYTGLYAEKVRLFGVQSAEAHAARDAIRQTCATATAQGLVVNVGHDLDLHNIPSLVACCPDLREASIGHELTGDALRFGFDEAVQRYQEALQP